MPMPEAVLAQGQFLEFLLIPWFKETFTNEIIVQDESLKKLMMAWYYAGYYTGLHEGQQQANQTKS